MDDATAQALKSKTSEVQQHHSKGLCSLYSSIDEKTGC